MSNGVSLHLYFFVAALFLSHHTNDQPHQSPDPTSSYASFLLWVSSCVWGCWLHPWNAHIIFHGSRGEIFSKIYMGGGQAGLQFKLRRGQGLWQRLLLNPIPLPEPWSPVWVYMVLHRLNSCAEVDPSGALHRVRKPAAALALQDTAFWHCCTTQCLQTIGLVYVYIPQWFPNCELGCEWVDREPLEGGS